MEYTLYFGVGGAPSIVSSDDVSFPVALSQSVSSKRELPPPMLILVPVTELGKQENDDEAKRRNEAMEGLDRM